MKGMRIHPAGRKKFWLAGFALSVALAGLAGWLAERRELAQQVESLGRSIDVHALALRGITSHYSYLPFTVAQHPKVVAALVQGEVRAANHYLEEVNRRAGSEALYVMNDRGVTVASSNWNTLQSFVGSDYSNRPYVIDALAGGSGRFYGIGKTTGEPGYFLSTPVRMDGRVIGVVAVKVDLRRVQETWLNAGSPVVLADDKGIIFLGSMAEWLYRPTRPLSVQEQAWLFQHEVYGKRPELSPLQWSADATAEGGQLLQTKVGGTSMRYVAVSEALPELGWTLTVTASYAEVAQARTRAWVVASMAAGLLVLGSMLWNLRRRQMDELEKVVQLRTHDLAQAHAFRKAMEDSLLVGMRARDLQGRIIYVNAALCEMTGYSAQELIGMKPPYPYWHPDNMEKHWNDNAAALSGQAALTGFESRMRHRDGHDVYAMVYTAPLIDANGQHAGWMSSVVDITSQKQNEAHQREQDEKLRHVQRRAIMDEMASTLAHEINQPLLAIGANARAARQLLERGKVENLKDCLETIEQQKNRAAEIVRKIKDHVRLKTKGSESCDINQLATNVLEFLSPEIENHKTRVTTRLQLPLPKVQGDRVLLEQVLVNLLMNALQAMQAIPDSGRLLELETQSNSVELLLRVSDCGPGIPASIAGQLFKSFVTTKEDGLGIGLSICRTIVESHGGRLSFTPRPQGGTTFTVQLPCLNPTPHN